MSEITLTIDSIYGGQAPTQFFGKKGQFNASIGIDPDFPITDSATEISGFIRPTAMEKFTGTTITGSPMWIQTDPKDANIYIYDTDGKVYSTTSALGTPPLLTTLSTASGNGMEYYDNAMYIARNTDIAKYYPLNGAPGFDNSYWVTTLGKSVLTNTTYPSIQGVQMPNHVMHRHSDNKIYICDVLSNTTANTNKGAIHYISTTKVTVEGDTNNGSSYNALDFDYGYYPTSIETYQTDLVVALIEGVNTGVKQKPASLTFWDTTSSSFQKIIQVEFPDPLITAMKNVNGILYVWSGNATGGCRLSRFIGGYSFQEVWYSADAFPPVQGAVDALMNRVIWGSNTVYPETSVSVSAFGSKLTELGTGSQNILKTTSSGSTGYVTSLKYVVQANQSTVSPIVGWHDGSGQGIDKLSTTYGTNVFRSEVYRIGRPFRIKRIVLPMGQEIAANMTLTPKIYVDEFSSSYTGASVSMPVIDSTNYPSVRNVVQYPQGVRGLHNFCLELRWTGSALLTVTLPIVITIETEEYANR